MVSFESSIYLNLAIIIPLQAASKPFFRSHKVIQHTASAVFAVHEILILLFNVPESSPPLTDHPPSYHFNYDFSNSLKHLLFISTSIAEHMLDNLLPNHLSVPCYLSVTSMHVHTNTKPFTTQIQNISRPTHLPLFKYHQSTFKLSPITPNPITRTRLPPNNRYRAAELKHGRIAMLAALGQITQYYVRLGDPVFSQVP